MLVSALIPAHHAATSLLKLSYCLFLPLERPELRIWLYSGSFSSCSLLHPSASNHVTIVVNLALPVQGTDSGIPPKETVSSLTPVPFTTDFLHFWL